MEVSTFAMLCSIGGRCISVWRRWARHQALLYESRPRAAIARKACFQWDFDKLVIATARASRTAQNRSWSGLSCGSLDRPALITALDDARREARTPFVESSNFEAIRSRPGHAIGNTLQEKGPASLPGSSAVDCGRR